MPRGCCKLIEWPCRENAAGAALLLQMAETIEPIARFPDYGRGYRPRKRPDLRVPSDDGHSFHGMIGLDPTQRWAVIARDRGQV